MKLKLTYILLFFAFFFSATTYAQVDRSIAREQYKRPKKDKKNYDFVEQSVNYLTKELKLDDFQKAAVKDILEGERTAITELSEDREMMSDVRADKARDISNRIYKKVLPLLSKDQAEIYTKMEESKKF